jgi:hypothetical protein
VLLSFFALKIISVVCLGILAEDGWFLKITKNAESEEA